MANLNENELRVLNAIIDDCDDLDGDIAELLVKLVRFYWREER